jgi:hypothetical protein
MDIQTRLSIHIGQARWLLAGGGKKLAVNDWMGKLLKEGVLPAIRLLEECDEEIINALEKEWVANLDSVDGRPKLLNGTSGGDGGTKMTPEVVAKMSAIQTKLWQDPVVRQRRIDAQKRRWTDPASKAREQERLERQRITHCHKGHAFTEENTQIRENGSRRCLTCTHEYSLQRSRNKASI